ncbi:unnamed protein product [Prorocentrum cordatum]|uniref:Secreted protein n=1 Tax=Prorocentrum cordatum TaxID=2364126 RepID=A0ABN9QB60_9DINO|nr:unnamed protein product [Polarella glacialis]
MCLWSGVWAWALADTSVDFHHTVDAVVDALGECDGLGPIWGPGGPPVLALPALAAPAAADVDHVFPHAFRVKSASPSRFDRTGSRVSSVVAFSLCRDPWEASGLHDAPRGLREKSHVRMLFAG